MIRVLEKPRLERIGDVFGKLTAALGWRLRRGILCACHLFQLLLLEHI